MRAGILSQRSSSIAPATSAVENRVQKTAKPKQSSRASDHNILKDAPCRNRTYNPVIKGMGL
jgi:hypothetical protein